MIQEDGKPIVSVDDRGAHDQVGLRYVTTFFQEHGRRDLFIVGTQADAKGLEPTISRHVEGTENSTTTNVEALNALFGER